MLHDRPSAHGVSFGPPHGVLGAHAPECATDMPCDPAMVAFQYVTPSHPHTGTLFPCSMPSFAQAPVLQSGEPQYSPAGHAFGSPTLHEPLPPPEPPIPPVPLPVLAPPPPVEDEVTDVLVDAGELEASPVFEQATVSSETKSSGTVEWMSFM